MNNVMLVPNQNDLRTFINFLFEGLDGYIYVVAKVPDDSNSWDQVFFEYPAQVEVALKAIQTYSPTHEIYMAPAVFKSKNALRENVRGSNVLWADFDGNAPTHFDIPPSVIVQSSTKEHQHVYWRLDQPIQDIDVIEDYNRRICYKYGADNSGWDANQVLRPPNTLNHKRGGLPVGILKSEELHFNIAVFDEMAPAPEKNVDYALWEKMDLPSLNDVIYQNRFGPDFKLLFEKSKSEVNDRSASLTNLSYICAEAGLSDKEIYVIISNAAERWEKFKHHRPQDRAKNLIAIIEHTRIKHPHSNYSDFDEVFEYSFTSLLNSEINVDWAIEGMLISNGVMMLVGESGIGKTQLSLQFMFHMAVGKDFLTYKFNGPQRIGFFSLEMGDVELKHFLEVMAPKLLQDFTPEEKELLDKNLTIIPFGESLPLNTQNGQDIFVRYLEKYKWDGIFVDSVGSAIFGNISSSETVQPFTNFNDKIRKRYGCFLWYIHHFRKPPPGQSNSGGQSDVYGDQYLTARATSIYTIVKTKKGKDVIKVKNPKNRHAATENDFLIQRGEGLSFSYLGEENAVPEPTGLLGKIIGDDGDQSPQILLK